MVANLSVAFNTLKIIPFNYQCRNLADNKVFFQHPDLMRALGIHETVMQLMVNTLNKAQQQTAVTDPSQKRRSSAASNPPEAEDDLEGSKVGNLKLQLLFILYISQHLLLILLRWQ